HGGRARDPRAARHTRGREREGAGRGRRAVDRQRVCARREERAADAGAAAVEAALIVTATEQEETQVATASPAERRAHVAELGQRERVSALARIQDAVR